MTTTEIEEEKTPGKAIFDVAAKLSLSLDSYAHEMKSKHDRDMRREQEYLRNQPRHIPFAGQTVLDANGNGIIDLGAPQDGRIWVARQFTASQVGKENLPIADETDAATSTFATAGAGSVSLPGADYISGIDVSITAGTVASVSTVTLSGVQGGPLTWSIQQETTSGVQFSRTFPGEGIQVIAGANPTLTISATAGGGSGTLNIYGTLTQTTALANWYVGMLPQFATVLLTSQWRHKQEVLPRIDNFSADFITVRAREHLYVLLSGGTQGDSIVCVATVHDRPLYGRTPVVAE